MQDESLFKALLEAMLKNTFSELPVDALLAIPSTLCVLPLSGECAPKAPGVIGTGLTGFHSTPLNEVWSVDQPVARGQSEQIFWSKTDSLLCVALWICLSPEGFSEENLKAQSSLESHIEHGYTQLLDFLSDQGYRHPLRFWNYLPQINQGEGDAECYKRFCAGRLQAFSQSNMAPAEFPAASALGHHGRGAVIFALAGHSPAQNFNNNHQINAYDYPRRYGASSPSFARASAVSLEGEHYLFISGTASIIGHETVAHGDLEGQLDTTLSNIQYLLAHRNPHQTALKTMKVYLRHRDFYTPTQRMLEQRFAEVDIIYTHADVCRSDLMVEIECFCSS